MDATGLDQIYREEAARITADLINRYPDRFLFGTDEVAPATQEKYLKVYYQYGPLWDLLSNDAVQKVRKGNYERIFDQARDGIKQRHCPISLR